MCPSARRLAMVFALMYEGDTQLLAVGIGGWLVDVEARDDASGVGCDVW